MNKHFDRVAIIGVGLLGASLGLALKSRALADNVVGVGRRRESLDIALRRGAVDTAVLDAREGVAGAGIVVIATPAQLVSPMLDIVLEAAPPHAVITDVASTKAAICAHARDVCPIPRRFIGSHPMAGSEKFGPAHGDAELYEGAVCLVEHDEALDAQARDRVCALWESVGARVVPVAAQTHDAMLARTSHLPHVAAAALAAIAEAAGATPDFIGNGFRDATRIAAARPEIWRDICVENRVALCEALEQVQRELADVAKMLEQGDADAIERFFARCVEARKKVTGS